MRFFQIDPRAILPTRGSPGSAGYDLYAIEQGFLYPGHRMLVRTGLGVVLENSEYAAKIEDRSGLAARHGLTVLAGRIDSDFTGEIHILLYNTDKSQRFEWDAGHRLAQLVIQKLAHPTEPHWVAPPLPTIRGAGGFGSTGV